MKKFTALMLIACMLLSLCACGNSAAPVSSPTPAPSQPLPAESSPQLSQAPVEPESGNILIAYFTWAENTHVENPEAVDVDASTSASVLLPGNTAKMAGWIQQRTGGELFSILVAEPYSSDYDQCLDRAADEKAENARPELTGHVEDMDSYDTVFLGFPNWWYTVPMAILSFLEEYDFSGKTVIPFCAHGTGGLAGSIDDLRAALPDSAELLEPIGVYRPDVDAAQPRINEWLDSLGFSGQAAPEDEAGGERLLNLIVDGQSLTVRLYDTPAANDLYAMLPLELSFEDFNGTEKISYLDESLSTEGEPEGCDPDVGDLCLYAPWGNLAIFYQDFRYSEGLIMLGHVDTGMDIIANMSGSFTARLEAASAS